MSQAEALKLAARALHASGQRDAASGNGMDLAIITPGPATNKSRKTRLPNSSSEVHFPAAQPLPLLGSALWSMLTAGA